MEILQVIGITSVCSGVILRIIDHLVKCIARKLGKVNAAEKAQNEAMLFLLREKLLDKTNEAISQGYRDPLRDKELRQGYDAYIALGGNGTMHDKWENEYLVLSIK